MVQHGAVSKDFIYGGYREQKWRNYELQWVIYPRIASLCFEAGFLSVRGDLRNNRKPQPAKTVLPNKHS